MSINLHMEVKRIKIDLWQTPTFITYMCLVNDKGKVRGAVKGKEARRSLYIYLEWVRSHASGMFKSSEDANDARLTVNEHLEELLKYVDERSLILYMM